MSVKASNESILNKDNKPHQLSDLETNLLNRAPMYIDKPNVENLLSLPRYQSVLISIRLYNRDQSRRDRRQRVLDELAKLSSCDETTGAEHHSGTVASISSVESAAKRIEELVRARLKIKHKPNPFLNDGLANYISQCLSDDLMVELALKVPGVDPRFFRAEPPSTVYKLNR